MRLTVLMSFSGAGGVERMVMNLVREFARTGIQVDLLVLRAQGPHLQNIPDNVNLIKLKNTHTLPSVPELARYLKKERPQYMLVAKDRAGRAALLARKFAGTDTKIVIRLGTNLSTALEKKSALSRWFRTAPMKAFYASVDKVVAVSEGVRQDTLGLTELAPECVTVIRNPVITPEMDKAIAEKAEHPWFNDTAITLIMGLGRLSQQKDFATLIHAFALVRKVRPCRLIILGEGGKREELETLIDELNLSDAVSMPGFQSNPYAWLKHASVFVLSSLWEGSPNVLTEALAIGIPSVATLCPSGPDEVLQDGKYGELVPMQDSQAMSQAILKTLDSPLPAETIKLAVEEYRVDISAKKYLALFKGED
ncbi:MAG: Glycosyl transferase, group 1 [uncultured Thiotrichaceae bacterium]|uniref:Glycosyl transferase, group 1 n=1 Tax=uncultured Thiotrichaceae bacterium TaxID=298394 RepID=A0A6S6TRJ6_9GAMM|nr:MAG: Glycosyl transferase, group 1 [uncultured Thiotrichaceae bacterium]